MNPKIQKEKYTPITTFPQLTAFGFSLGMKKGGSSQK